MYNLNEKQVEYITKVINEHIELSKEDIKETWFEGYSVTKEVKELRLLKGIVKELSSNKLN